MLTLIISILVTCYHFAYRIVVGETLSKLYAYKKVNYDSVLLKDCKLERVFYELLRVKHWKDKMVTAKPYKFNVHNRDLEEVLRSMIIAEIVHIYCFVLSYLPLLLIIPFGSPFAFIVTSFMASLIDLACIVIQRYNIPRVIRLIKRN